MLVLSVVIESWLLTADVVPAFVTVPIHTPDVGIQHPSDFLPIPLCYDMQLNGHRHSGGWRGGGPAWPASAAGGSGWQGGGKIPSLHTGST